MLRIASWLIAAAALSAPVVDAAAAERYPLRPIRMIIPSGAGGITDIPYDTVKAFAPITLVSAVSPVLIVSSQFPARSVQELIAIAKEKPGQLNHGFDAVIRADVKKWAKIIKEAGIRAQ